MRDTPGRDTPYLAARHHRAAPLPTGSGQLEPTEGATRCLTWDNDLPGQVRAGAGEDLPACPPPHRAGGGQAAGSRSATTGSHNGTDPTTDTANDTATGCVRGQHQRVLPHRHQPDCPWPDQCPGCQPCERNHCRVCRRNHADDTCPTCLAMARSQLTTITQLTEQLRAEATNGRHAYRIRTDQLPGGDALVMLTPASLRAGTPSHPRPEQPGDPQPPLDVLHYWADRWTTHHNGQQLPSLTVPNLARWLAQRLHLIATTPTFPRLARDLRQLTHQLENVLHAGDRPDVSRVPCLRCGTRLTKVWADRADRDRWRCPRCGETYDRGRYERAQHHHLASRGAERYVPVADAIAATGRPENTVRAWIRDKEVATRRDAGGPLLVWWPHVRARHLATPTRDRRTT